MNAIQPKWESAIHNWGLSQFREIKTVDMHTAGEPLRVIVSGYPEIPGQTIVAKRKWVLENADDLRKILMLEPRGHADMYGCILTEPENSDSDFGVLFMHNEGYSTMCGHAIIAITKLVVEAGFVSPAEPCTKIRIDTPAGQVEATANLECGKVDSVSFLNVPSFVLSADQRIDFESVGEVVFDLAFGGAFYAYVDATQFPIELVPENFSELVSLGKKLKQTIAANFETPHPYHEDLSFLYGVIFTGPPQDSKNHSRHVCVFADGEVDRSPTGTGVSGRIAILHEKENHPHQVPVTIESILGSTFEVASTHSVEFGNYAAVIPQVSGQASVTGIHRFLIDPDDTIGRGFVLR